MWLVLLKWPRNGTHTPGKWIPVPKIHGAPSRNRRRRNSNETWRFLLKTITEFPSDFDDQKTLFLCDFWDMVFPVGARHFIWPFHHYPCFLVIIGFGCLLPRMARGNWSTTRAVQCHRTIINAFCFSLQARDQFFCTFLLNTIPELLMGSCCELPGLTNQRNMHYFGGIFNLTLDMDNLMFNLSTPGSSRTFWPRALGSDCQGPQDVHDSDFLGGRRCNFFSHV